MEAHGKLMHQNTKKLEKEIEILRNASTDPSDLQDGKSFCFMSNRQSWDFFRKIEEFLENNYLKHKLKANDSKKRMKRFLFSFRSFTFQLQEEIVKLSESVDSLNTHLLLTRSHTLAIRTRSVANVEEDTAFQKKYSLPSTEFPINCILLFLSHEISIVRIPTWSWATCTSLRNILSLMLTFTSEETSKRWFKSLILKRSIRPSWVSCQAKELTLKSSPKTNKYQLCLLIFRNMSSEVSARGKRQCRK